MKTFASKRAAALLLLITIAAAAVFGLTACTDPDGSDSDVFDQGAAMTLAIAEDPVREITVDISGMDKDSDLIDVLEKCGVSYELDGTFLNAVGTLAPQAPTYIYLYTSVEADKDVSQYGTTTEYGGKTLYNSGKGALDMTIEDGCTIYIGTITY